MAGRFPSPAPSEGCWAVVRAGDRACGSARHLPLRDSAGLAPDFPWVRTRAVSEATRAEPMLAVDDKGGARRA
jgi:hypothetical protein